MEYGDRGVVGMILSLDPTLDLEGLADAKEEIFGTDRVAWCIDPSGRTQLAYQPRPGFDFLAIIDRDGNLHYRGQMFLTYEQLASEVQKVL